MIFQSFFLPLHPLICLRAMKDDFIIPLNGLKPGKTSFGWKVGAEFFRQFENKDIRAAEISVDAVVEKSGTYLGIDAVMKGVVTVPCDRCGDDVELSVNADIQLSVKFGSEPVAEEEIVVSEGRETVYLPEDGADMDMSQTIYDFACLSLPMQKVHGEGGCNPDALRYLAGSEDAADNAGERGDENNPFAVLKGLYDN